ncbi:MAG: hypothetical protein ACQCXQ_00420 [Verrucomicrobiales bacterium]|nr:hypothetical protein [Verrucomicrobiota bacterium JB025]
MDPMHPYEHLTLFTAGLVLALWLIGSHALMLAKPDEVRGFLKKFSRNQMIGQVLLGIGLAWSWLLVAPEGMGIVSSLAMDLGEFNGAKGLLRIIIPLSLVAITISVRDFLAVRALGLLGLLVAAPLLDAAFLKDPSTRLLVPIYAYGLLTASMFWVGMPYLFRDAVDWVTADGKRWKVCGLTGLAYGMVTLLCALAFWRGY